MKEVRISDYSTKVNDTVAVVDVMSFFGAINDMYKEERTNRQDSKKRK